MTNTPSAPPRVSVYVAAGSNISPTEHLRRAITALAERFPDLKVSPAYRNAAVGFVGDDFINLAMGFTTTHALPELINELQAVEALCGRSRSDAKWAPRTMDIDLLLYGDAVGEFPGVSLPRPDLMKRPYMLGPLAQIAPELMHPVLHQTIGSLWSRFESSGHQLQSIDLWDEADAL